MLASKNQHKTSYQSQSPKNSAIKMYVFINHESQGSDTARETFTSIVPATVKTCFLLESLLFATISCKMGMLGWQILNYSDAPIKIPKKLQLMVPEFFYEMYVWNIVGIQILPAITFLWQFTACKLFPLENITPSKMSHNSAQMTSMPKTWQNVCFQKSIVKVQTLSAMLPHNSSRKFLRFSWIIAELQNSNFSKLFKNPWCGYLLFPKLSNSGLC